MTSPFSIPVWVDPPEGRRYGFPKIYYPDKDGHMLDWLIREGMPPEYEFSHVRVWPVEAGDNDD